MGPGVAAAAGRQAPQATALARQLTDFRERHGPEHVVVVSLSPTAPQPAPHPAFADLATLRTALAGPERVLPPHALHAYAALGAGCGRFEGNPVRRGSR
ncbi:inositol-3-phosphate synthase [Streptomyces sp. NRRL F-5123]|uniref:inositol-3-phosphate synthase n=1 Tax=Streptomyces sp. NRRL F-5123 TaxID=1463856 RepID=UPI0004E25576|nr:inositol-3-phosphate synthase [Streptomyces sp. NRRL F-5123]